MIEVVTWRSCPNECSLAVAQSAARARAIKNPSATFMMRRTRSRTTHISLFPHRHGNSEVDSDPRGHPNQWMVCFPDGAPARITLHFFQTTGLPLTHSWLSDVPKRGRSTGRPSTQRLQSSYFQSWSISFCLAAKSTGADVEARHFRRAARPVVRAGLGDQGRAGGEHVLVGVVGVTAHDRYRADLAARFDRLSALSSKCASCQHSTDYQAAEDARTHDDLLCRGEQDWFEFPSPVSLRSTARPGVMGAVYRIARPTQCPRSVLLSHHREPRTLRVAHGLHGATRKAAIPLPERPQRRSLFDSMSNHIANSVNCDPEMRSRATRTIVAAGMSLPRMRSTVSRMPRTTPTVVIRNPKA